MLNNNFFGNYFTFYLILSRNVSNVRRCSNSKLISIYTYYRHPLVKKTNVILSFSDRNAFLYLISRLSSTIIKYLGNMLFASHQSLYPITSCCFRNKAAIFFRRTHTYERAFVITQHACTCVLAVGSKQHCIACSLLFPKIRYPFRLCRQFRQPARERASLTAHASYSSNN